MEAERVGMREWLGTLDDAERPMLTATFDTRVTKVRYLPACASRRAARELTQHGHHDGLRADGVPGPGRVGAAGVPEVDRAIAWSRRVATEAQNRLAGVAAG